MLTILSGLDRLCPTIEQIDVRLLQNFVIRASLKIRGQPPCPSDAWRATGAGLRIGLISCVCYKRGPGLSGQLCLLSIFLLAKLTASWCTTAQVWAEKPPTCSGSTTTPARRKRAR